MSVVAEKRIIEAVIVGLGRHGRRLVDAVQGRSDRLRFVRGIVRRPGPAAEFAHQHGLTLGTDFAGVLADPRVRAVVLATPHSQHPGQVIAAAAAGKPVFCEKPLALTLAEAARAVEACRSAGVVLGVGTDKRFWPSMRELRRVVASGELGEILHVEAHNSNEVSRGFTGSWRAAPEESPGGGMTGTGIHALDALVSIAGPVRRLHAQLLERASQSAPTDTVSVLIEFVNGISGMMSTVRATPFYWRVHVFGSRASAEALGQDELVLRKSGSQPIRRSLDPVDALRAEIDAFADAVEGRAPYPIPEREMLDAVAAFEAIVRSIEARSSVTVAGNRQDLQD